MADLRDMWSWPSNSGFGYMTDTADWSNNESYGMDQRLDQLLDGTYTTWPNLDPVADLSQTVDSVSALVGQYKNYLDSEVASENFTFYKIARNPIVEATLTLATGTPNCPSFLDDKYGGVVFSVDSVSAFTQGDEVFTTGFTSKPGSLTGELDDGDSYYLDKLDPDNIGPGSVELYTDAALTTPLSYTSSGDFLWTKPAGAAGTPSLSNCQYVDTAFLTSYVFGDVEFAWYVEPKQDPADQGSFAIHSPGFDQALDPLIDSAGIVAGTSTWPEDARWSGSNLNSTEGALGDLATLRDKEIITQLHNFQAVTGDGVDGSTYGWPKEMIFIPYAGAGSTNPLNITTERYAATISFSQQFNNTSGGSPLVANFNGNGYSLGTNPGGYLAASITRIQSKYYFWARAYVTVTTGSISGGDTDELGGSSGTSDPLNGKLVKVVFNSTGQLVYTDDFTFTVSTGGNATLRFAAIEPWTNLSAKFEIFDTAGTQYLNSGANLSEHVPQYEIDTLNIRMPGTKVYSYQDASNVTQYGAQVVNDSAWVVSGSTPPTSATSTDFAIDPSLTATVDASGYLQSVAISVNGRFTTNDNRLFVIESKPDQYVPPTPYAPDVWDTDDEWDSDGFDINKEWPEHVRPASAKFTLSQPSSVSRSQNGTKYVRSSGVVRYQLEVAYAPMTYDDFRIFERTVQAARGQATPFYFKLRYPNGENILMQRTDSDNTGLPTQLRLRNSISTGDKTMLFEGFLANSTNAFVQGETTIFNVGDGNGGIVTIVNDVDSNKYGEAKIRLPYGTRVGRSSGSIMYKDPFWVVVTLAEADLEYTVGTDGLYRMTVVFDFDEWK